MQRYGDPESDTQVEKYHHFSLKRQNVCYLDNLQIAYILEL